jgi:tetratricopeptide (TPR) repeat protein
LAFNNKAIALSALNKYEQAIQCFDKVIELNPDDHKGLYNKGMALFKLHKYDEAIKFFRKSITIYPNDRQTQLQLDKCLTAKKKEILLKNQMSNAFSLI